MADTLSPVAVVVVPLGSLTLGPFTTLNVPVGSMTLGPFTTLDVPVGAFTLGPFTEYTVWAQFPPLLRVEQVRAPLLGLLRFANLDSTADQIIPIEATKYLIRRVVVVGSTANNPAAVGGIYTGPGKTGTAVVPAGQTYSSLFLPENYIDTGLDASTATTAFSGPLYLSLTTPSGSSCSVDIYVFGDAVES